MKTAVVPWQCELSSAYGLIRMPGRAGPVAGYSETRARYTARGWNDPAPPARLCPADRREGDCFANRVPPGVSGEAANACTGRCGPDFERSRDCAATKAEQRAPQGRGAKRRAGCQGRKPRTRAQSMTAQREGSFWRVGETVTGAGGKRSNKEIQERHPRPDTRHGTAWHGRAGV
jgi:hypothetical protein